MVSKFNVFHNGFKPLPVEGKNPVIKSWTSINIDYAQVDRWGDLSNTGIRCEGLMAVDVDIEDKELVDRVASLLPTTWVRRRTNSNKVLFLYRFDEDAKPSFLRFDRGSESVGVDFLSTKSRMFVGFGVHPSGGWYTWDHDNPSTTSIKDLPSISAQELRSFREKVEQYLLSVGCTKKSYTKEGTDKNHVEDLTLEMEFDVVTPSLGMMKWGDIKKFRKDYSGEMWCNLTAFRPSSDSGAGHILLNGRGAPYIYDFVTHTAHLEKPPKKTRLRKFLRKNVVKSDFVMVGGLEAVDVRDPGYNGTRFTLNAYKNHLGRKKYAEWEKSCTKAAFQDFRPDLPKGVSEHPEKKGFRILNTYDPPIFEGDGGDLSVFYDYMKSLIPDDFERECVLDWMGQKLKDHSKRLHGIFFIAPKTQGAGRDTWFRLMSRCLGQDYTRSINFNRLSGGNSQSEFNGFLKGSTLVYCPEVLNDNKVSSVARYEYLKTLIDPHADVVEINEKHQISTKQRVYSSVVLATNHENALRIPEEDRRLLIIYTPNKLRKNHPIHDWMTDDVNIGNLIEELVMRSFKKYSSDMTEAPKTMGRKLFMEGGRSILEELVMSYAENAEGVVTTDSLLMRWLSDPNVLDPAEFTSRAELLRNLRVVVRNCLTRGRVTRGKQTETAKVTTFRPILLRPISEEEDNASFMRQEIEKNFAPQNLTLIKKVITS